LIHMCCIESVCKCSSLLPTQAYWRLVFRFRACNSANPDQLTSGTTRSPLVTECHPPTRGARNTCTHCHHAPSPAAHLYGTDPLKRQAGARPAPGRYEASTRHRAQHRHATCNTVTREQFAPRFAAMVRTLGDCSRVAAAPQQCPSHTGNAVSPFHAGIQRGIHEFPRLATTSGYHGNPLPTWHFAPVT
jgi:hypothetical protein